jgi:protease-4
MGSPARPLSAEEKRLLQASIDDAYQQFLEAVRAGRHLSPEKLKALADGRIFTGRQALTEGLVDEIGNYQDALQAAIALAHLPAKPVVIMDETRSFSSLLREVSAGGGPSLLESAAESMISPRVEYRWK